MQEAEQPPTPVGLGSDFSNTLHAVQAQVQALTMQVSLIDQKITLRATQEDESRKESRTTARAMIPVALALAAAIYANYQFNTNTAGKVENMDRFGTEFTRVNLKPIQEDQADLHNELVSLKGRVEVLEKLQK